MTPTSLAAIRLERTRDVIREMARSLSRALPIVVGVMGPLVIAAFALLAWAALPVMRAPALPPASGLAVWLLQTIVVAWPLWALRGRLLPPAWCVQLRCLPICAGAMWRSDAEVAAVVLAPIALAYVVSAVFFTVTHAAWWLATWPVAAMSTLASWLASCALGAAALAWQRRTVERGHPGRVRPAPVAAVPGAIGPGFAPTSLFRALLWQPSWRGAMTPGGPALLAGLAVAILLAVAWMRQLAPVVPGAAWAFAFSALLLTLTERSQRALEANLDALAPALLSWPVAPAWRWQSRLLPVLPMLAGLAVAVVLGIARTGWRGGALGGFAVVTLAVHGWLVHVPASRREAHVCLWALGAGLATAFGSEVA